MKQGLFLFVLLFILTVLKAETPDFQVKDSIKKQSRWFITTYPSSIFIGDVSVGAEFNNKRIRQELAFFCKGYTFMKSYIYDQGFGINYYVKYNFVNRKNYLMSIDLGYVFRRASYENKVKPVGFVDSSQTMCIYNTDKRLQKSGLSIGISNLFYLGHRFYIGMNACVDLVHLDYNFVIKEHVSGEKLVTSPGNPPTELAIPYTESKNDKGVSATFLIKLAYEL